jgi:hypothetical protein
MYGNENSDSKTRISRHLFMLSALGFVLIVAAAIAVADIEQGKQMLLWAGCSSQSSLTKMRVSRKLFGF